MTGVNAPAQILEIWVGNGEKKAALSVVKMLLLGILAGMFIGLGAHVFLMATSAGGTPFEAMMAKLVGAALFPVGLMCVILCGAELFTGNNLMTLALSARKITAAAMLKNWIFVYVGNFIGSVLTAWLLAGSGLYVGALAERAMAVATAKVSMPPMEAVARGILCNILVVLACWMQAGATQLIGKIFAIWFPIMLFVFAGFEHSIANMTYIPLGMMLGADVSVGALLVDDLLPVTIGNVIGGALFIPAFYHWSYAAKK